MTNIYQYKDVERIIREYPHPEDISRFFLLPLFVLSTDAQVVVELGVGNGHSAEAILLAVKERKGKLFLVDYSTPTEHLAPTSNLPHARILRENPDTVTYILKSSTEVGKDWKLPIDWLHIDTDHKYDTTKNELELWYPHVKVGGLIVMHDSKLPDVRKATNEFLLKIKDDVAYFNMEDNVHGLGFIRKLR